MSGPRANHCSEKSSLLCGMRAQYVLPEPEAVLVVMVVIRLASSRTRTTEEVGGGAPDGGGGDGGGGGGSVDGGGVTEPLTVAHPDRLKPDDGAATDTQPPEFLGGSFGAVGSMMPLIPGAGEATPAAFGILMPLAAAILRSSFSSRLRSFSLRLSTSSFGKMRALACMSFNLALWW